MGIKLKGLLSAVVMAAASTVIATEASAQQVGEPEPTVLEVLDEISYAHSGDYYRNRTYLRQADYILGFGWFGAASFPELEGERDAEAIEAAYNELMFLQTRNTPTLRVPDLRSPYNTSVQLLPVSQVGGSRVVGSELNFEPLPRR
jgi:hypothetical protein